MYKYIIYVCIYNIYQHNICIIIYDVIRPPPIRHAGILCVVKKKNAFETKI